jgi:hypothetical protein
MCKVFRQVSLVAKVKLCTGFRISQCVVMVDKLDTVFFTACFQAAYSGGYPFSISGDIRSVPS